MKNLIKLRIDDAMTPFRKYMERKALPLPMQGWIKFVRESLQMTSTQLASRMNISQPTLSRMEAGEVVGTITMNTLRRAAHALNCELYYAFVPRTSLSQSLEEEAHTRAKSILERVNRTMSLENQEPDMSAQRKLLEEITRDLIDSKRVWSSKP